MIKLKNNKVLLLALTTVSVTAMAKENVNVVQKTQSASTVLAYNCTPGTNLEVLNVNNVRTTMRGSGDFWWDGQFARYEIPSGSGKNSVYAGSIWIGGLTDNNNLKVAAMTYRQTGVDFWPGPLDGEQEIFNNVTNQFEHNPNYGLTSIDVCSEYNTHFKVTLAEVSEFYSNCINGNLQEIPSIMNWPGNGVNGELKSMLAPYVDLNNNGVYEPEQCEYPAYDLNSSGDCLGKDILFGDETIFWVYNDRGNIHTESGSEAIGLELQTQAFGFSTNDEINDMTFYNFKILNRSIESLNKTFFGTWVDSDVGNYIDDYVGCDVQRGLGYTYNGDAEDEGASGYGVNPPALGMDFFRGPLADANDGVDNDKDGCVDCTIVTDEDGNETEVDDDLVPEQIIMSKFVFYNNNRDAIVGNPDVTSDFYNYLSGRWRNGNPITYGGDGQDPSNPPCDYMFPDDTDPSFPNNPWTEETAGNEPDDRRFLITAGPFTLEPGAVNTITTGLVWARANSGGPFASVRKMRAADDKAQALFDNCFQVLNGPDAPDLSIQSYDRELIITLTNAPTSNNYQDKYEEVDPTLISTTEFEVTDNKYHFEGYQLFQLANPEVTSSDLYNLDKARLIRQSDIVNFRKDKDGETNLDDPIAKLINYEVDEDLGAAVPRDKTIQAGNSGLRHSFSIKADAFATGDSKLINSKTYYFMAIAYGYNEFMGYLPDVPFDGNEFIPNSSGQKFPYKAGRKNIKIYEGRPHQRTGDLSGVYGTTPEVTRIQGNGSNGRQLEFTTESDSIIVNEFCAKEVTYKENKGPLNVYVIDPSSVVDANYQFLILPEDEDTTAVTDNSEWILIQNPGTDEADTVFSALAISVNNEQIIPQWGLAVDINNNAEQPLVSRSGSNGFINSSITYENPTDQWLTFFQDDDAPNFGNWIVSGTQNMKDPSSEANPPVPFGDFTILDAVLDSVEAADPWVDPNSVYENIINGGWAPYALVNPSDGFPRFQANYIRARFNSADVEQVSEKRTFERLPSIKVVFTPNEDLWTRVPVIDLSAYDTDAKKLKRIKTDPSVDKAGKPDGTGYGWSWFPGYAIDKISGKRLNMMFGENSDDSTNLGNNMMFDPTHVERGPNFNVTFDNAGNAVYTGASLGGKHYLYVDNTQYRGADEKQHPKYAIFQDIIDRVFDDKTVSSGRILQMYFDVAWASIPLRVEGNEMNESEIVVDIDISQNFSSWADNDYLPSCIDDSLINNSLPVYEFTTSNLESSNVITDLNLDDPIDLVGVVPNPYYGGSYYETSQIDHKVRIINLPKESVVSVYTVDGVLVKQASIAEGRDYDWDLKNLNGISIASGIYIIHIKTPTAERSIKWFGSLRPIDLDTF